MFTLPPSLTSKFVSDNPDTLFIVGMTVGRAKEGGESAHLIGLPNTFWIPVKVKACMDVSSFFEDTYLDAYEFILDDFLREFKKDAYGKGWKHVVPDPELAQSDWAGPLFKRAPKCSMALKHWCLKTCSPWQIDYKK